MPTRAEIIKIINDKHNGEYISIGNVKSIVDTVYDLAEMKEDNIYKHSLSLVLVKGLSALQKAGGRSKTKDLKIDYTYRSNFQKLANDDYPEEPDFYSFRKDNINIIFTECEDFFKQFVKATEIAKEKNLLNKDDRIELFQEVLYKNKKVKK